MIEVTVGLPMFRSDKIAWLALESLCRQVNIDFEWELIVAEEQEDSFSAETIKEYIPRLREVGCERVEYISLSSWIPLARKWKLLAQKSNDTLCFLLQGADDYSYPERLSEAYSMFKDDPELEWLSHDCGYFYDIGTEKVSLYDHRLATNSTAIGIAIKTQSIKSIPTSNKPSGCDSFLYRSVKGSGGKIKEIRLNTDYWKKGIFTNGLNNISQDRNIMVNEDIPPFTRAEITVESIVGEEIYQMLKEAKSYIKDNKFIHGKF